MKEKEIINLVNINMGGIISQDKSTGTLDKNRKTFVTIHLQYVHLIGTIT